MTFESKQDPVSEKENFNILVAFSVSLWLESGKIDKNNGHMFLFHCKNIFWVPWEMFEHTC